MIIILILIMSIGYGLLKMKGQHIMAEKKTAKITDLLSKFLIAAPIMFTFIIAILLMTVLKGRFLERSSHAIIVFLSWAYATAYYIEFLKNIKNKLLRLCSIFGSMIAVSTAVILTPLDRYCMLVYTNLYGFSYVLGALMFIVLYFSIIKYKIKRIN